jgi:hypothetical protein
MSLLSAHAVHQCSNEEMAVHQCSNEEMPVQEDKTETSAEQVSPLLLQLVTYRMCHLLKRRYREYHVSCLVIAAYRISSFGSVDTVYIS